jgi:hypothetical protein
MRISLFGILPNNDELSAARMERMLMARLFWKGHKFCRYSVIVHRQIVTLFLFFLARWVLILAYPKWVYQ